jgi:hypothetical protein
MALDTYSGLQTTIGDFLNRADLTAIIPSFITLAEAQMSRRLASDGPVREMMGRSDATVNAEFIPVPADFMGVKGIVLTGSTLSLDFVEPEIIAEYKAKYPSEVGDPRVFSIVGSEFQFWPWVTGGSYAAEISYWKRIPALTAIATTNWLLASHPDAYLYTSLIQSAPYLKDDERLTIWGTLATQILADLVTADKVARFAPHISVPYVAGGTP